MTRVASQCKVKCRALVHCGLGPDTPPVAVDDALHNSEAHACALILLRAVQPLKDAEEPISITHVEAYAIVFDEVDGLAAKALTAHFNAGALTLTGELDSIREEVDQDLLQQGHVSTADRQVTNHDVQPPPRVCSAQVFEHLVYEVRQHDRLSVQRLAAQPCEGEQVNDELAHLLGTLTYQAQVALGLWYEVWRVLFEENP